MDSQFDPEREPQVCCSPGYICRRCEPDVTDDVRELLQVAINVVDMYDQGNTSGAIVEIGGTRVVLLNDAIDALRKKLNSGRQRTILL